MTGKLPRTGEAATVAESIGFEEFRRIGVAGWIDEPQIPVHGGDRSARDPGHALAGTAHG